MSESKNDTLYPEIIMGLVAPLGSDVDSFIDSAKKYVREYGYDYKPIKVTDLLIKKFDKNNDINHENVPNSLKTYFKMEACTAYRKYSGRVVMAALAVKEIVDFRENNKNKKIIYVIDQLKNLGEYEFLNNTYGENYIKISCFSSKLNRNSYLEKKFKKSYNVSGKSDDEKIQDWIKGKIYNQYENFWNYISHMHKDASSSLIEKWESHSITKKNFSR